MKRNIIIQKLINEGFSEKTLSMFTDKQILALSERVLQEQTTTAIKKPEITIPKTMSNPMDTLKKVQNAVGQSAKVSVSEDNKEIVDIKKKKRKTTDEKNRERGKEEYDKRPKRGEAPEGSDDFDDRFNAWEEKIKKKRIQKKLSKKSEVSEDGWDSKLVTKKFKELGKSVKKSSPQRNFDNLTMDDSQTGRLKDDDFYTKLRKSKYNPEKGELELPDDVNEGKKSKEKKIGKKLKLALTLKKLKEHSETQEWVDKLVETNYHSITTKNEIMELINSKLVEHEVLENNPQTSPKPNNPSPTTIPKPGTKPQKPKRENPFEPKHNPKPKAEVKLPEFMKFKNIGIRLKNSK